MKVTIEEIQKQTASFFGIDQIDILGTSRARVVAYPRQIAMYLARDLTSRSLPEIGRCFRRDHSTVHHACAVVPKRPGQVAAVATIRMRLES